MRYQSAALQPDLTHPMTPIPVSNDSKPRRNGKPSKPEASGFILPERSVDTLIKTAIKIVHGEASIVIAFARETYHGRKQDFTQFVVTLPEGTDPKRRNRTYLAQ